MVSQYWLQGLVGKTAATNDFTKKYNGKLFLEIFSFFFIFFYFIFLSYPSNDRGLMDWLEE